MNGNKSIFGKPPRRPVSYCCQAVTVLVINGAGGDYHEISIKITQKDGVFADNVLEVLPLVSMKTSILSILIFIRTGKTQ